MLINQTKAFKIQVGSRNNSIQAHISCLSDYLSGVWSEFQWFWIKKYCNKSPFMSCCFVFDWNGSTPEFSWMLLGILIYCYHAQYMYEDSKRLVPVMASAYHWTLTATDFGSNARKYSTSQNEQQSMFKNVMLLTTISLLDQTSKN